MICIGFEVDKTVCLTASLRLVFNDLDTKVIIIIIMFLYMALFKSLNANQSASH